MANITVLGAGGWGLALAKLLFENGHSVIGTDNFDDFYPRKIKELRA